MPLFQIDPHGELSPFRRLLGGDELYEKEIEDLFWSNPEAFTGESLFPVARQFTLPHGGRPDVVLLDKQGRVVVVEIKRDVDRSQLAQCLEYAGWARTASLDELSGMYRPSRDAFFQAWLEFTQTTAPVTISRPPRLMLVARQFLGRTGSAFEFLSENSMPVRWIEVTVYEDASGRRLVDVQGEHEPILSPIQPEEAHSLGDHALIEGRRIQLADLLEANLIHVGDKLVWRRPRSGQELKATLTANGAIELEDGRGPFSSPSRAAVEAAGVPACDGWIAWRVGSGGPLLHELRVRLVERLTQN
jgi:hypothetical protein